MKKTVRTILCALLAFATLSFAGCDFLDGLLGDGDSQTGGSATDNTQTGGNQTGGGNGGGSSDGNQTGGEQGGEQLPPLPEIPDAPQEETVVLPDALDFTPRAVTSQYGYRYFAGLENGEKFCRFYLDLYNACCALEDGEDVTPTAQNVQDGAGNITEVYLYIADTVNYGKYGLTASEAVTVWKTFRMEYPEFYWIDNEVTYSVPTDKSPNLSLTLNVHIFEEYALGSVRLAAQEKIEAMANDCYSYLSKDMTATEMALTVYDYVISSTQYAYKEDGETPEDAVWAHNLVGLAERGKGVCETYSKAYEYLCSLIGIEALTVSGTAGKTTSEICGHAWNVVKIDGVWYNVDATWGDQEYIGYIYREWFGKGNTEFTETHFADTPNNGYGITWQYALPTVSQKEISPVRMGLENGTEKTYACIDYAFADITDEQGRYVITLHPDTTVSKKATNLKIHLSRVTMDTAVFPKAENIKFVGRWYGATSLEMRSVNGVTLWSDIYLQDIAWTYPTMYRNGKFIETSTFSSYHEDWGII